MINLDLIENIAHPLWEIFDPDPDLFKLLKRFNYHFFNNDFRYIENDQQLHDYGDYPYPVTLKFKTVSYLLFICLLCTE